MPDHFLEEHLWDHVVKKHLARIFLWTLAAFAVIHLLIDHMDLSATTQTGRVLMLLLAAAVGLIPESGPHLIFLTLFAQGVAPFSVLVTSSIVQDGHGAIPLLSSSKRAFIIMKLINLVVGLGVGFLLMAFGM